VTLPVGIKIPGLSQEALSVKNEIFVDILERITVVVNSSNSFRAFIDGAIQMKSYLSGSPGLRLCLNEDLVIAGENKGPSTYSSSSILDDVLFHESADISEFESQRIISINPPDGEFVLMNYRISDVSKIPFRIYPTMDIVSPDRVDIQIAIRADVPEQNYGSNMVVSLPLPSKIVRSVSCDFMGSAAGTSAEHGNNRITWNVKKLQGASEVVCRARIHLTSPIASTKLWSPISLHFEIPMYSMSNLQVRYLRISEGGRFGGSPTNTSGPQRWVRYVAQSQSYLYRI
jgi:AP-4 complex subunit mu-1